nr:uncharacterized protein CTRU02_00553 [Colletotrichum truncatum]KAF6801804.1 hypothetical protein CTRU02_00553 [Colletotrichum truncatum]
MDCESFLNCLTGHTSTPQQGLLVNEKPSGIITNQPLRSDEDAASEFIDILRTAEKSGKDLQRRLKNIVTTTSWTESLAELILNGVETLVRNGETIGQIVKDAIDKAYELAHELFEFAREHPVLVTIVAIGVLAIISPWVLEVLGFGEFGPIAGSFAARWQSLYAGFVPKGSLFSFLQELGMTWT